MNLLFGLSYVFISSYSLGFSEAFMSPSFLVHTTTAKTNHPSPCRHHHHDPILSNSMMKPCTKKPSMKMMMMMVDPFHIHDFIHSVMLPTTLVTFDASNVAPLVDTVMSNTDASITTVAAVVAVPDAANIITTTAATAAVSTPELVTTTAAAAPTNDNGGLNFLTAPIQGLLSIFHSILVSTGMSANTWGISIIAMTLFIKALTYPLTRSQLESTTKMQALQPTIKDIQSKYQSNPEVMNQKIAEVYQTNQINPLAGCIPALVQIPIFIGLYRAVLNLAKEDQLDERFLWLPNLEGPVYGADPSQGGDWLFKNWNDGIPSLGWEDTLAFLSLPIVLVVSQYASMALISPTMANKDQPQQEQPFILKLLPLMVGWFSLNVPAALGIYWVVNNIVTTLLTLQIRSALNVAAPIMNGSGSNNSGIVDVEPIKFTPAPIREKPVGFGSAETSSISKKSEGDMKMITTDDNDMEEDEEDTVESSSSATDSDGSRSSKKRGGKKKRKN